MCGMKFGSITKTRKRLSQFSGTFWTARINCVPIKVKYADIWRGKYLKMLKPVRLIPFLIGALNAFGGALEAARRVNSHFQIKKDGEKKRWSRFLNIFSTSDRGLWLVRRMSRKAKLIRRIHKGRSGWKREQRIERNIVFFPTHYKIWAVEEKLLVSKRWYILFSFHPSKNRR